jgi:hypothetical protein
MVFSGISHAIAAASFVGAAFIAFVIAWGMAFLFGLLGLVLGAALVGAVIWLGYWWLAGDRSGKAPPHV